MVLGIKKYVFVKIKVFVCMCALMHVYVCVFISLCIWRLIHPNCVRLLVASENFYVKLL